MEVVDQALHQLTLDLEVLEVLVVVDLAVVDLEERLQEMVQMQQLTLAVAVAEMLIHLLQRDQEQVEMVDLV